MIPIRMEGGENKAWSILSKLNIADVSKRADVRYDPSLNEYILTSYGMEFHVSPSERDINSNDKNSDVMLDRMKDFFRLSLLWYLVSAKDIPLTGRLIRPLDVRGGQRFFTGTHTLPLDDIAIKYGREKIISSKRDWHLEVSLQTTAMFHLNCFPFHASPSILYSGWKIKSFLPGQTSSLILPVICRSNGLTLYGQLP